MECFPLTNSYLEVGEGSWGEDELVESSEEGSHEGVGLGDVDLAGVVDVELRPGSWEELRHVGLHLGLGDLLGDEKNLGGGLLASVLVEDLGTGGLSSSIGDWDSVMVEDVVHNIVLISTVVSGGSGIGGSWWWWLGSIVLGDGNSRSGGNEKYNNGVFHLLICYKKIIINKCLS